MTLGDKNEIESTGMSVLAGKRVVLAITGSIAAYKAAFLARLLVKQSCEVRVLMTPSAKDFITPLTLSTLTGHDVMSDISDGSSWNNHVELGLWADVLLIAPCTATTLGKMAAGICDTMVLATYLSAKCQVMIAPAMDLDMWQHPATQANIKTVVSYGNKVIPVGYGALASGLVGAGRMAEPEEIVAFVEENLAPQQLLVGRRCVVTAGPTHEAIDPVRYIGNHSTGRMGIELARAAASRGAHVTLVLGPSALAADIDRVDTVRVQSAQQMYEAVAEVHQNCDIAIFAAAVADYRPATVADQKLKKADSDLAIALTRTIDIAKTLGARKTQSQLHVGFALETDNEKANAKAKLQKKNFDLIVLNSMNDDGAGFGHMTNKVTIYDRAGSEVSRPLQKKSEVAADIMDRISVLLGAL